jgi:hypothetical protein
MTAEPKGARLRHQRKPPERPLPRDVSIVTVADWPVFLWSSMHHDIGDTFAVGDTMSWDVELIDGHDAGWPEHVLADVMVTIRPRPCWAHRGAIAEADGIQACWRGPTPPGTVLPLSAGLVAHIWNPPFRANVTGMVRRIRTVAYARAERDGVLLPSGPWVLEDVERTPRRLTTAKPGDDPSVVREGGLLVNLAITQNTIERWD